MQVRHSCITSKSKQIGSRNEFSPASLAEQRRVGGSDQQPLVAAARVRLSRSDVAAVPRQPRRSDFRTGTKILQRDICHLIENEALRIAKQQSSQDSGATPVGEESSALQVLTVAFSTPQSTLEYLRRHRQINEAERQFLTYTIQAVSFVLGMDPAISRSLACVRRRAKQVAEILANAIGQSCPPPEATRLLISPFLAM
jgi:hypothetical protein